jgi:hypothetical protein
VNEGDYLKVWREVEIHEETPLIWRDLRRNGVGAEHPWPINLYIKNITMPCEEVPWYYSMVL